MRSYSRLVLFCVVSLLSLGGLAQMQEHLLPVSITEKLIAEVPVLQVLQPDWQKVAAEDNERSSKGVLPLFSRNVKSVYSINDNGRWQTARNGRIWQLQLQTASAQGLVILLDELYLPAGATLHVYTPDKKTRLGAYTHANTPAPMPFNAGIAKGNSCVLEVYEPAENFGRCVLRASETGVAYRFLDKWWGDEDGSRGGGSDWCEVNVACSEGNNWQDQIRSVAKIIVASNQGQGFCSGSLINNVHQDCTPYFLSAQHCSDGTSANQFAQYIFYFNNQAGTCNGTSGPSNQTINGCTKIADSNDNGGATGSDFLLLQLNTAPPANYNVFYAGWNTTTSPAQSGVGIHHPSGDIKKISTFSSTPSSTSWGGSVSGTHWSVQWVATPNGHGVTEPGSSGSAIFNQNGEIVGTLTGGDSYCNTPNNPDDYGKFSRHWTSNGSTANRQLKPWLDPDNTGTTSLGGTNAPCGSQITNDAGIFSIASPSGNVCGNTITPQIILRNYGSNSITSVIIYYDVDGNLFSYNWSGTLNAGSTTTVVLPSFTLSNGSHTITVYTANPNNSNDNNTTNDTRNSTFTITSGAGINVVLKTDSYGSETTWQITNEQNNVVLQNNAPYNDVQGGQTFVIPACLPYGCYTFTVYDSYGDGMNGNNGFGTKGDVDITSTDLSVTYAQLPTPDFGDSVKLTFCLSATSIYEEATAATLQVYPNPSQGLFTVVTDMWGEKKWQLTDLQGRLIQQGVESSLAFTINANAPSGFYTLQLQAAGQTFIHKIVLR